MRDSGGNNFLTHLYPGKSDSRRKKVRQALKDRGYTHAYIYVTNENDYGEKFDFYGNVEGFKNRLSENDAKWNTIGKKQSWSVLRNKKVSR